MPVEHSGERLEEEIQLESTRAARRQTYLGQGALVGESAQWRLRHGVETGLVLPTCRGRTGEDHFRPFDPASCAQGLSLLEAVQHESVLVVIRPCEAIGSEEEGVAQGQVQHVKNRGLKGLSN